MGKIKLYIVAKVEAGVTNNSLNNICTFVTSKKEVREYLINRVIIENWSHYTNWCDLHEKKDEMDTRKEYIVSVLGGSEAFHDYVIKKEIYRPQDLARMLRVFNSCVPVGSSYESKSEFDLLSQLYMDIWDKIKETNPDLPDLDNPPKA